MEAAGAQAAKEKQAEIVTCTRRDFGSHNGNDFSLNSSDFDSLTCPDCKKTDERDCGDAATGPGDSRGSADSETQFARAFSTPEWEIPRSNPEQSIPFEVLLTQWDDSNRRGGDPSRVRHSLGFF